MILTFYTMLTFIFIALAYISKDSDATILTNVLLAIIWHQLALGNIDK